MNSKKADAEASALPYLIFGPLRCKSVFHEITVAVAGGDNGIATRIFRNIHNGVPTPFSDSGNHYRDGSLLESLEKWIPGIAFVNLTFPTPGFVSAVGLSVLQLPGDRI